MDRDDLEWRIKYHRPDADAIDRIAQMRRFALDFGNGIRQMVPAGRPSPSRRSRRPSW